MEQIPTIEETPRQVRWSEIGDFGQLDERVSAVTVIFGSVIGVNNGFVSWCPDDHPPTEQERLAWIWLYNPALGPKILPFAKGQFGELLAAYHAGTLRGWWGSLGGTGVG